MIPVKVAPGECIPPIMPLIGGSAVLSAQPAFARPERLPAKVARWIADVNPMIPRSGSGAVMGRNACHKREILLSPS